jgi:hypothetical protein
MAQEKDVNMVGEAGPDNNKGFDPGIYKGKNKKDRVEKLLNLSEGYNIPLHPRKVVIKQLAVSIEGVIEIGCKNADNTIARLLSCIGGLKPEDFQKEMDALRNKAEELNRPNIAAAAGELTILRKFFMQDAEFLHNTYVQEIDMIRAKDGEKPLSLEEKQERFTKFLSTTTEHHIKEVCKEIHAARFSGGKTL